MDIATTRILDYYILPCKAIFRVVVNFMKCLFPILKEYLVSRQLGSSAFASIIYKGSQIFVKKARSCGFAKIKFGDWAMIALYESYSRQIFPKSSTRKVVQIGNWCLFQNLEGNGFLLGRVLSFTYFNNTKKSISMFERIVDQKDHEVGVLFATLCMV